MKKLILLLMALALVNGSAFAKMTSGGWWDLEKTTDVYEGIPKGALFVGDPYEMPDYPYVVSEATYKGWMKEITYTLAMGIHDVSDNGYIDTWYSGDGSYYSNSNITDGAANWNLDVYVNPVLFKFEELSGTISYTNADGSVTWSDDIEFSVEKQSRKGLGWLRWLPSYATGSENAVDLAMNSELFDPTVEGLYNITLNYGLLGLGVSNSIIVEVGDLTFDEVSPLPAPIVPAPGAIALAGFGTAMVGYMRRRSL